MIIVIGWCYLLLNVKKRIIINNGKKIEYYYIKVKWDLKLYILSGGI